ncbi:hypothetical protein Tco_1055221 [Tanacetum coccineum]|uniref:Uncharacterized protein n=1 Tax=Tanacetum coccineum TaxID=301880 RepID=A0ABQ5H050_9ASTR
MLSPLKIQGQRKRSIQAPLKTPLNLNISLPASLPMQRSQVILLKTKACNKIKSSSRETMMNNSLTRRLPKPTGSRNPSDLQLLILIRVRDNMLTFDLLRLGLVKLHMLKNLLIQLMSSMILHLISLHFQNQRDLPRDIPLDSVVVLRYEKRSKSENKGKVPTEMELVLEQTQQGTSYEVSVSAEGVEELKRKVKIKGEKKEALLTLRQKPGQYICCQESQR